MDIISILVGGGILAFMQFLITRYDSKHDKQKAVMEKLGLLEKKVDQIDEKIDEREATPAPEPTPEPEEVEEQPI